MKKLFLISTLILCFKSYSNLSNEIKEHCPKDYSMIDGSKVTPKYLCLSQTDQAEGGFVCVSEAENRNSVAVVDGDLYNGRLGGIAYNDYERNDLISGFLENKNILRVYQNTSFLGLPIKTTLDIKIDKQTLKATLKLNDADEENKKSFDMKCVIL